MVMGIETIIGLFLLLLNFILVLVPELYH